MAHCLAEEKKTKMKTEQQFRRSMTETPDKFPVNAHRIKRHGWFCINSLEEWNSLPLEYYDFWQPFDPLPAAPRAKTRIELDADSFEAWSRSYHCPDSLSSGGDMNAWKAALSYERQRIREMWARHLHGGEFCLKGIAAIADAMDAEALHKNAAFLRELAEEVKE